MNIHIRTDVRELPIEEKLKRFQRELTETPREDRAALVRRYVNPDAPLLTGAVSVALGNAAATTSWRNSTLDRDDQIKEFYAHGAFDVVPPKKREVLVRMDSLVKRLVTEWKRGGAPLLDGLLAQTFPGRWKPGTPITEDSLRMLAAQSLQIAAAKQAEKQAKGITR